MRFSGNWLTLLLFIVGLGITVLSSFYMLRPLYRYIFWEKTEGTIVGVVLKETDDDYSFHEKAVFTGPKGQEIEVVAMSGTDNEESTYAGQVTIFYNPEDPSQASIFLFRDLLIGVMIPFGLLLIVIGWPLKPA
ncbi:MAG: DUF3592 domain-containing protein [Cyclobacteriaceae bacterium]